MKRSGWCCRRVSNAEDESFIDSRFPSRYLLTKFNVFTSLSDDIMDFTSHDNSPLLLKC